MKRNLTYLTLALILSLAFPVLALFLFREYRLIHLSNLDGIGIIEFLFAVIILPAYLSIVYFFLNKRFKNIGFYKVYLILSMICIGLFCRFDFINWWDTEGKIISIKDAETRDVIEIGLLFQFIIAISINTISLFAIRSKSTKDFPPEAT